MKESLPPYPGKIIGPDGDLLFQRSDIYDGQNVYQQHGLMDHGAVWGHGSQRGAEFSAVTLHIVTEAVGDFYAQKEYGTPYESLDETALFTMRKVINGTGTRMT